MNKSPDYQAMLLDHMRTFPTELPTALLEATVEGGVMLNGGDFSLKRKPTRDLFFDGMYNHGFQGPDVVFLSTPSVTFAYDPTTGREIANTMQRYGVEDRKSLLPHLKQMLRLDSYYLRGKGLEGLASAQDRFIERL